MCPDHQKEIGDRICGEKHNGRLGYPIRPQKLFRLWDYGNEQLEKQSKIATPRERDT